MSTHLRACIISTAVLAAAASPLCALDLIDVQPAAMAQPQINAIVFVGNNTSPQVGQTAVDVDPFTGEIIYANYFTITAYLDTGASGILISNAQNSTLNVPVTAVTYSDTGVVGSDIFQVSTDIHVSLANFYPRTDLDQFNGNTPITTPYTPIPTAPNTFLHAQVGPYIPGPIDPDNDFDQLFADLNAIDIVGMPGMTGKVVVLNPKHVNDFLNVYSQILNFIDDPSNLPELEALLNTDLNMHAHIYAPGTPFHPGTTETDPGIPQTTHHIKLTYASFDRFTQVNPAGSQGPTLAHNPFIGKDPVALLDGDLQPNAPKGIKITRTVLVGNVPTTLSSEGNWLFDTGAAASIISSNQAANLGVHYLSPPSADNDSPVLLDANNNPIPNQFTLAIGGIGGTETVAGFFLDSLLLRTMEGNPLDDNDPNHLRFLNAPVLVLDVSVVDANGVPLTLDGILGMNFFVASANISSDPNDPLGLPTFDTFSTSYFDWITFDEPNGILGLAFDPAAIAIPEPASLLLLAPALLLPRRRRTPH